MIGIKTTAKFRKDLKLLQKRGFDLDLLWNTIDIIRCGSALPEKAREHKLKGEYVGYSECHITNDWILIYCIDKDDMCLVALRTGTHTDVFDYS